MRQRYSSKTWFYTWAPTQAVQLTKGVGSVLLALVCVAVLSGCACSETGSSLWDGCGRGTVLSQKGSRPEKPDIVSLLALFSELRVGSSEAEASEVLNKAFVRVESDFFHKRYPFRDWLPCIDSAVVSEWRSSDVEADGWPLIVFVIFESPNKLALVDAFRWRNGDIRPIVDGVYNRNLRSVKMGDSMEVVYRVLGKRECVYFKGADGKWRVRFSYWGYGGRSFVIEADAASGVVLYAGDGTL